MTAQSGLQYNTNTLMVANRFACTARTTFILVLMFWVLGPLATHAQGNDGKPVFKGSAQKILEQANTAYNLQDYKLAKEAYIAALNKDPENWMATYRIAKCSYYLQEYEDGARYYESALDIDPKRNDTARFEYGTVLRILDRHNDALEQFVEFRKKWPNKGDEYSRRVKVEIEGCKWVEEQRSVEPIYRADCIDINTPAGDQFPSILKQNEDERYLVFTSHRSGGKKDKNDAIFGGYGEAYSNVFIAKIEDDSTFGNPESLGKKVNTKLNDGSTAFTPDGMTMYYSICNSGKLGYGCSIYKSEYDPRKKRWGKPKIVESLKGEKVAVINSRGKTKKVPTYDVQPTLSADGNTMYFVSDREGGYGKLDLWYATWQGDSWSEPMNLGARINTPFNDQSPYLSESGNTLYFASNGRKGFGGLDLFSTEGGVGNWGDPENLGAPVNSTYDDFGGVWTDDDSLAYFTSNRPGCSGRDDIFWARKIPEPPVEFAVHGLVRDVKSKLPIPFATVILFEIDFEGDLIPVDTFRTDQSAEYNFPLVPDKEYKVLGNAPEYLANEENFNTNNRDESDIEMNIDIELERIIIDEVISLENIYYDFDKSDLRVESVEELDSLIALLTINPNITIQIGSHTDSNGSEPYNKSLSERRAESVVRYLIENGISGDRLEWYGWGESQLLVYPEMSDEDEQLNRRTEFQILTIDFDFIGNN